MSTTVRTFAGRVVDVVAAVSRRVGRGASDRLGDLDDRTLADIGVSRSEIASIEAEARGFSFLTRRRIAAEPRHA